ncbi:hypothetical protein E4191_18040 (plasmid) [Paracoccus liaowanqingii]|uniref:Uncharacterized protein n=1 Tax=Paracoccus liaowanqingii TaxID=2560053 RepID=A0A4Y5STE7_9RHOB|nr:hypothetical protein [Paracoccus liaowanqingii]QDA36036.1 hypothetical protein E4191_18040 [Paracoccus liaowanqingii]
MMSAESDMVGVPGVREQAYPIKRVLDQESRKVVGWLYRWNTGQVAVMWKGERCESVIYE